MKWTSILVGSLLCCLPGLALAGELQQDVRHVCKQELKYRGFKDVEFKNTDFNKSRSNYGLTGQFQKHGNRYEFNCVVAKSMQIQDLVINQVGGGGDDSYRDNGHRGGGGAPAEAQVACAEEADRSWGLSRGTSVPTASRSTGSGMFEVEVQGGRHRGTCTVTGSGDVKFIMDR
jgi:hypothetical protein